jgi:hypothetical protein
LRLFGFLLTGILPEESRILLEMGLTNMDDLTQKQTASHHTKSASSRNPRLNFFSFEYIIIDEAHGIKNGFTIVADRSDFHLQRTIVDNGDSAAK